MILFFLPWLDQSRSSRSATVRAGTRLCYGVFVVRVPVLGYLGTQPPSPAGTLIAQICTFIYFGFFLLMPWWSALGTFKPVPERVRSSRTDASRSQHE